MNRQNFLKLVAVGSAGLLLPAELNAAVAISQAYSVDQLIGKSPRDLVGNSYLTTMQRDTAKALKLMQEASTLR